MKIFGFRTDPKSPRYAIVSCDNGVSTLLNATGESKLVFPAAMTEEPEKLLWLYLEFTRILTLNPDIDKVVIKTNEYMGSETKAKRFSSYQEAALILAARAINKPVFIKTYSSLSTKSATVRQNAIDRVGQTAQNWDSKMADAVIACWWGCRNP